MNVWLTEVWRAWRASLRRPGFVLLAVSVLALGVGAGAAVFTLIDATLLRQLPYPQSRQLVEMGRLEDGDRVGSVSPQQYQHMQGLQGVQSMSLIMMMASTVNIAADGKPQQAHALYADRGLIPTLGVTLKLGRNFTAAEDQPGGARVVLLSYGFWQSHFGGKPDVLGHSMQVEGLAYTIIGVLPVNFERLQFGQADLMLPVALTANDSDDSPNFYAIARLAPGIRADAVGAQLTARMLTYYNTSHDDNDAEYWKHKRYGAKDLKANLHADSRPILLTFLASAFFVLLIALVNLTNLMLMRALSRSHDAAVRNALGASATRLALPALAEGLLVGLGGAFAGIALATIALAMLRQYVPTEWVGTDGLHINSAVCALAFAVGLLGALLSAALGIWRGRVGSTLDELRDAGRGGIGRHSGRLGRVLVIAQMTLATCLLCGAGLFLHALYDAERTPLGFQSSHRLTFELAPIRVDYPDVVAVQLLSQRLIERLHGIPGVDDAAGTTNLPAGDLLVGQFNDGELKVPGVANTFDAQFHAVTPGFFSTFDISVHQGRVFNAMDVAGGEPVVVVNETLARKEYDGQALGKHIQIGGTGRENGHTITARIVGVVNDTHQFGPLEEDMAEILYVPLTQMPGDVFRVFRNFEPMRFAIHVQGDPYSYANSVRKAVAEVAPDQPIAALRSMDSIVRATTDQTRLSLLLVGLFALIALTLAAVGMYAVMAVATAARQREFGVRLALGASPARLSGLVLRGGLLQVGIGLVAGSGLAMGMSGMLRAVLVQIGRSQFDAPAMIAVACVLVLAGLLASLVPALRASRIQPIQALRGE
jgi:putative ABC transport system permease protein